MLDDRTNNLQEASSRIIMAGHREPSKDMEEERLRATFDVIELSHALNGGKEKLERR